MKTKQDKTTKKHLTNARESLVGAELVNVSFQLIKSTAFWLPGADEHCTE